MPNILPGPFALVRCDTWIASRVHTESLFAAILGFLFSETPPSVNLVC